MTTALIKYQRPENSYNLGYVGPDFKDFLDVLNPFGVTTKEYLVVCQTIAQDLSYNDDSWAWIPGRGSVTDPQVKAILDTYIYNAVKKNIPEYTKPSDTETVNRIVPTVAKYSQQSAEIVERALKQLYWATEDRRVPSGKYIRPYTYSLQPHESPKFGPEECDWWCRTLETLQVVAIVGGALGTVWLSYNIYKHFRDKR